MERAVPYVLNIQHNVVSGRRKLNQIPDQRDTIPPPIHHPPLLPYDKVHLDNEDNARQDHNIKLLDL